jgi:hypothetical protein
MDIAALVRKTVLRLNKTHAGVGSSVQLSLALNMSKFWWHDDSLEKLIAKLLRYASVMSHPARPLRVAVRRKGKLLDLEEFFDIHPSHWVQMSIRMAASGLDEGVRKILEDHGYQCDESVGVEGSVQQLGAFSPGAKEKLMLVFWAENHRLRHKCDLLIPVTHPFAT